MKLEGFDAFSNLATVEDVTRFTQILGKNLGAILNGGFIFADNFRGQFLDCNFTATNTDLSVTHKLGFVPTGYLLTRAAQAMTIYDGSRAFSKDTVYLRANATGTATVLIF